MLWSAVHDSTNIVVNESIKLPDINVAVSTRWTAKSNATYSGGSSNKGRCGSGYGEMTSA